MNEQTTIPRSALVLGWLGFLPFALFATLVITQAVLPLQASMNALIVYGVIILSFMGGAQWGIAMSRSNDATLLARGLAISVLPALAAFGLWFLPNRIALLGLSVAFVALLVYDVAMTRAGNAPDWYAKLRIQLTSAVIVCLLLAAMLSTNTALPR